MSICKGKLKNIYFQKGVKALKFRTDLAIEKKEMLDEANGSGTEYDGIKVERLIYDELVTCTRINILNEAGMRKMEKPVGTYITIELDGLVDQADGVKEKAEDAFAAELKQLMCSRPDQKTLVVGLGNADVTPDSLGPATAMKITVTRHMFLMLGAEWDERWGNVSCISPGVTGMTGIETAEQVKSIADLIRPDQVIIVDALASKSIKRVSTTIQINDAGIEPGSGMGNMRKALNSDYLGCKVICVGVPTVIDAATIIREALESHIPEAEKVDRYIEEHHQELIVTSTDIDQLIKEFSDIIANGINKILHPGIYS